MKKQKPIEIFMPPNILKARAGGSAAGLDMNAIRRAEQALETLKTEFADWIAADVQKLVECRDAFAAGPSGEHQADLFRASHDLRGQARTFEFPLVARVAASLCKLLDGFLAIDALTLIDAHVSAIRIIVRDNIKDRTDPTATLLAHELEMRVAEFLSAQGTCESAKPAP